MSPRFASLVVLVISTALLPGCQANRASKSQLSSNAEVERLEKELESVRQEVAILKAYYEDLGVKVMKLEIDKTSARQAELDLTSRDYLRLDTDTGSFLISVQDVAPYLDGYRVTLNIGNPSNATYHGFALRVKCNRAFDPNKPNFSFDAWNKAMHTKKISFAETLHAGAWNKIEVILPATTKEQLGYFAVAMKTNTVSLREAPSE